MSPSNAEARLATAIVELDEKPISYGDAAFMSTAVVSGPSETREVLRTDVE